MGLSSTNLPFPSQADRLTLAIERAINTVRKNLIKLHSFHKLIIIIKDCCLTPDATLWYFRDLFYRTLLSLLSSDFFLQLTILYFKKNKKQIFFLLKRKKIKF